MENGKPNTLRIIGPPFVAAVVTFIVLLVDLNIIDSLPRTMQGEAVSVPWRVCMAGVIGSGVVLPWLLSLRVLRQPRARVYFMVCLGFALAVWYFLFGFDGLLSKAYRRGL